MLRAVVVGVMAVSALALTPSSVCAQGQDAKLSELLPNLYRDVSIDEFDAFVSVFSEAGIESDVYFPQIVEALGQRFLLSASIIRGAANRSRVRAIRSVRFSPSDRSPLADGA